MVGCRVTVVNHGRKMIMKVDDDAINFIKTTVFELIRHISDTSAPTKSGPTDVKIPELRRSSQCFTFEGDTPNIMGKVVWDPMQDSWKLSYRVKGDGVKTRYTDEQGESLSGIYAYNRAISAWNVLDGSTRHRIALPVGVAPERDSPIPVGVAPGDDAQSPNLLTILPMAAKWHADDGL